MKVVANLDANVFAALAEALWKRGEDSEVIARDLAYALRHVIEEAQVAAEGLKSDFFTAQFPLADFHAEIDRLLG